MATQHRQQIRVVRNGQVVQRQKVVEVAPSTRSILVARLTQLMWLATGVLISLLGVRLILKMIAANPANTLVDFIYTLSGGLVAPFQGIVDSPNLLSGAELDMAAVFAILAYSLVAWIVISLFRIVFASAHRFRHVSTIENHIEE